MATTLFRQGVLHVFGSEAADAIMLRYSAGRYTVDGSADEFPAAAVRSLQVVGYGGNDSIDLRAARVPVHVDAGAGFDAVVGGAANDSVVGGSNDDVIWAGAGDDAVDGGTGDDRIYGEDGSDWLDGGAGTNALDGGAGNNTLIGATATQPVANADYYARAFADPALRSMTRAFASDHWMDRSEVLALYAQAATDGTVSAVEFTDLARLVAPNWANVPQAEQYGMADPVRVLGQTVSGGDPANAAFQGAPLGNLKAGSTGETLRRLVDKWFLGQDRPAASGTYRSAGGSLFQSGPSYGDVRQGGVGDCYFVAALAEIAQQSPDAIRQMFTDNGDGTFTVRFFRDGAPRYVTVDRKLPVDSAGRVVYAGVGGGRYDSAGNELWVALAEKAYAQINQSGWVGQDGTNSYAGISGGYSDDVMTQVTDAPATWRGLSQSSLSLLTSLATSGTPAVLATKSSGTKDGVVADHGYTLAGYNPATGAFALYNPWGNTLSLTWAQIGSSFSGLWYAA